jgi:glycerophosphoryl diester phosphodiesterase
MWNFPRVLAHRGGGTLAPENTLAALRCGHTHGFRAVEFDVMALSDGSLVLMHDEELGRTVAGQGSVATCTREQLAASDAGSWFSAEFAGEPVPSFEAAADFCLRHHMQMNVEIKPVPGMDLETGRRVAEFCLQLPAGSVLLSSFSVHALRAARAGAPQVPRALLVEAVPADWRAQLDALGALALHPKASLLTAAQAAAVKAAGVGLMVYTVNDPGQARALFAMGVDAICTDRLDLIAPDFAANA